MLNSTENSIRIGWFRGRRRLGYTNDKWLRSVFVWTSRLVYLVFAWVLWGALPGCGGRARSLPPIPVTTVDGLPSIRINADWDDVDAAMIVASQYVEATVTRTTLMSPTHRRYVVTHVSGEAGEVNVTRADAARDEQVDLLATCRIGRLNEPERDRALLRALAARLAALRGVEFAPLPE